jgi:hypothetical protein
VGGHWRLHHQGKRTSELGTTLAVASSSYLAIFSILMMEAEFSFETSVLTATRRHIPEDDIIHSHRRKTSNLT